MALALFFVHLLNNPVAEVFKTVRRRRVELTPNDERFEGHKNVWAKQKNVLNKFYVKFKGFRDSDGNGCDDDDLPPGVSLKDIEFEAGAHAPKTRDLNDFLKRGGAVPLGVFLCTVCPACCGILGFPKPLPIPIPVQ